MKYSGEGIKLIDLCLKEGRPGLPHRQQFISVRSKKASGIGTIHFYIKNTHVRVYILVEKPLRTKAIRLIRNKFIYYKADPPKIGEWKYGLKFSMKNALEFDVIRKWLKLGKVSRGN